jgi:hypothetical protein
MSFFHDEEDGPAEPVKGLPEALPEGETILWQGRPSALALAIGAFRLRWVFGYFIVMSLYRVANLSANDAAASQINEAVLGSLVFCTAAVALILGLSFAMSRAALFTITNDRVVLRYGAAIRKYVNVPFSKMTGAQLKRRSARVGDISLQLDGPGQPPYLKLWPFARPFKYSRPEPTLRGMENAEEIAQILARAVYERAPESVRLELGVSEAEYDRGSGSTNSIPAT